jgi:hypothetical protein
MKLFIFFVDRSRVWEGAQTTGVVAETEAEALGFIKEMLGNEEFEADLHYSCENNQDDKGVVFNNNWWN